MKPRRLAAALITLTVAAASLAIGAQPAAASSHAPRTDDTIDSTPAFTRGSGSKEGTGCGFWGCSDHFWRAGGIFTAQYFMGDLQGTFTFYREIPEPDRNQLTGRIRWHIYEKRTGSSSYRRVQSFSPPSQRGRRGWWHYSTRVALDGKVIIVATGNTSGGKYGVVGLSRVKLKYVDLHSRHKGQARLLCFDNEIASLEMDSRVWGALDEITPSIPGMNDHVAAASTFIEYVAALAGKAVGALTLINTIATLDDTFEALADEYSGTNLENRVKNAAEMCDLLSPDAQLLGSTYKSQIASKTHAAIVGSWANEQWCRGYGWRLWDWSQKGQVCFDRAR